MAGVTPVGKVTEVKYICVFWRDLKSSRAFAEFDR